MSSPRRRRAILEDHDVLAAPAWRQDLFWRSYNRKGWRGAAKLADLASAALSEGTLRSARRLEQLAEAWRSVVPMGYERSSRVEGFSHGRLVVLVDSAATRYVLSRQVGRALVAALNGYLREARVRAIEYRVGSLGRGAEAAQRGAPPALPQVPRVNKTDQMDRIGRGDKAREAERTRRADNNRRMSEDKWNSQR
ncbi:MAG: DUF721 domain-containing protein [Phycisphaerae bacterium]|nr:DUF721 domain-containing protein [Phycisphaerae bacterium]